MFNALFAILAKGASQASLAGMSVVVTNILSLITLFEKEFAQDKDAKNAAIDSIIEILQAHKDK